MTKAFCLVLLICVYITACSENPLGENSIDSTYGPGVDLDTEAPTSPSSLSLSGNPTFTDSPSLTWVASSDDTAVVGYEVALGTTSGGEDLVAFSDIGNVLTYQYTGLSTPLTSLTLYYISVRAFDLAGNISVVASETFYAPGLDTTGGAYHYADSTYALTCLDYLGSAKYDNEGNGRYWIDPDSAGGNAQFQVYCDMTKDGGGWTLIANRRIQGSNIETCQSGLNGFFQNTCGSPANITSTDSYSIGDTALRESILSDGEWLFVQYDVTNVEDSDDAFIIHYGFDLFFTSTGVVNRTAVSQVCDINNSNCDNTNVEFLWSGDGYFSSSKCNSPYTAPGGTYFGNYGYCHNGNGNYNSNSLFGNRDQYGETKLWGHPSGGGSYYERIFIR